MRDLVNEELGHVYGAGNAYAYGRRRCSNQNGSKSSKGTKCTKSIKGTKNTKNTKCS